MKRTHKKLVVLGSSLLLMVLGKYLLRWLLHREEAGVEEEPLLAPTPEESRDRNRRDVKERRRSWVSLTVRTFLFIASIALSLRSSWMLYHDRRYYDTAVLFYAASLFCLWLAFCSGVPQIKSVRQILVALGRKLRAHRWEILWLGLIFAVALFFRLYRFGYFPPADGLAFEEAQTGGNAFAALRHGYRTLEFPLTAYLPALSFALWGESTLTLRLPFLILGCLTVLPFYFLLRELVDYRVALFGTFLLAVSRWHAVVSRVADELFLPIFFEVLLLYLFVKGDKTKGTKYFFWLAILSGYMLYAYTGYRVIPFLIILFFVGSFFKAVVSQMRHRGAFGDQFRGICGRSWQPALVFTVAFLIVAGPLLALTTGQGDRFFIEAFPRHLAGKGGAIELPTFTPQQLARFKGAVLMFTHKGATYAALNLPGEPMLDPVSGALFALSIIYCVLTFFRPYRPWFLLWTVVVVLAGTFPPNLYIGRFGNLIPLVFIFVSFMMGDLSGWVNRRGGENEQRSFGAFLTLLATAALVLNFSTLFERQISDPEVRRDYQNKTLALCNYAASLTPDTYVYVWDQHQLLDYVFRPSDYSWACHDIRGEAVDSMESVLPAKVQAAQVGYIFVNPAQSIDELSRLIHQFYPQILAPSAIIEEEQGTYRIVVYLVSP
ncbi:MAG: glycosyltransferase family 39 protein [Anaerolineales bacterium]|nr:glycosyltransferase family 39 protein [Anaerolineales bacterium]